MKCRMVALAAMAVLAMSQLPPSKAASPPDPSTPPVTTNGLRYGSEKPNAGQPPARMDAHFEVSPDDQSRQAMFGSPRLHFVKIPGQGKGTTVLVWGGIQEGDSHKFRAAIEAAAPIHEVRFYSNGGLLSEAMKIGRFVRSKKLWTRVTAGASCESACNFMFLGGVHRTVEPGGQFGVHMFATDQADRLLADLDRPPTSTEEWNDRFPKHAYKSYEVRREIEQSNGLSPMSERDFFSQPDRRRKIVSERISDVQQHAAKTAASIALFLLEMQLSMGFLEQFSSQPDSQMAYLSQKELETYNIVNGD